MSGLGVVIIGRNEGERLKVCLRSVMGSGRGDDRRPSAPLTMPVVYVDSGSTDASVQAAQRAAAEVVELSPPFTAARGRNAGLARLLELAPDAEFVQFIDGDVELAPGWLQTARMALEERPDVAVVCGRLRERFVEMSIYNRLCDAEWDRPVGEAAACGGIAMMRIDAVRSAGGFREDLIAGEEPELCLRLRRAGGRVLRLSAEMGLHDAAMERLGQWWRRSVRAGHGFAQGAWVHRRGAERYRVRELVSIGWWGAALPAAAFAAAPASSGLSLVLFGLYPVQCARISRKERLRGRSSREARLVACFTMLGKFAQMQGVLRFAVDLVRGRASRLVEYKGSAAQRRQAEIRVAAGR